MKIRLVDWLYFCCIVVSCGAMGAIAARGLQPLASEVSRVASDERGARVEATGEMLIGSGQQFVQEPPVRSSRRPAFPNPRDMNKRANSLMLQTFEEVVASSIQSTVRVSVRGNQVALGAIVDSDGWILTKSSQLPSIQQIADGRRIVCTVFDGSEYPANVVSFSVETDLSLLKIEAHGLRSVEWDFDVPSRGNWLATTDLFNMPAAVGVASASLQSVARARAVLGVVLQDAHDGARIREVLPTSGASEAGLKVGDVIFNVDGNPVITHSGFLKHVADGRGGQTLELGVLRGERKLQITARLMDLSEELLDETEMEVSGQISHRATGFETVLMHDSVLLPTQCGGPIVNLDGKVVGINIARAGRVSTYALPTSVVQPLVKQLLANAKLVSRSDVQPDTNQIR